MYIYVVMGGRDKILRSQEMTIGPKVNIVDFSMLFLYDREAGPYFKIRCS
jgi:hypothetical protein